MSAGPRPALSVVIPAYNEASRLGPTLDEVSRYLDDRALDYEVLVVDDGSSDGTAAVVGRCANPRVRLVSHPRNLGKGAAVRSGVRDSAGASILISDADLSTPIEELEKLEPHLADVGLVIGSRAVEEAEIERRQPRYRELLGQLFNKLVQRVGVPSIHDTQCGFKLVRGDLGRELFGRMITPGFAFDVELVWLALNEGAGVREVGVVWRNSPLSRVRLWIDPARMLVEIARFRWHHRSRSRVAGD